MASPYPVNEIWWAQLYDELLADVLLVRQDPAHTRKTLAFLEEALALAPHARVFDQCCGIGSLAIPLALRGYQIVGVDLMAPYIRRAREDASAVGATIDLHTADAAVFEPHQPVDGAFNWATSFGYFETDEANLGMLRRAFDAFRPGGHYALDFMNVPQVLTGFKPVMVTPRQTAAGDVVLTRHSIIGKARNWLYKTWTYSLPDGSERTHRSRVRLYRPEQIADLMTSVGFVDVIAYGDVDQHLRHDGSPRCITVGRRP